MPDLSCLLLLLSLSPVLFILFSQDPSVTQARQTAPAGLEEYNPFTEAKPVSAFTDYSLSSFIK